MATMSLIGSRSSVALVNNGRWSRTCREFRCQIRWKIYTKQCHPLLILSPFCLWMSKETRLNSYRNIAHFFLAELGYCKLCLYRNIIQTERYITSKTNDIHYNNVTSSSWHISPPATWFLNSLFRLTTKKNTKHHFTEPFAGNFVWNFKGHPCNFIQNYEPIHRKNVFYRLLFLCAISDIFEMWRRKS